jgi:hypothetical protein
MKFRKGIVFSTFWRQKSISEKLFSKHVKSTAAVLIINSASKVLEKNTFFIIKMASESRFKTIQQLTCFVMKNRVRWIFFTSDIVLKGFSCVLFMPASENNLKSKNIFSSIFMKFRKGIVFSTFWSQKSISEILFSKHDKSTAAVLIINSASKVLEKNTFFIIKMASESRFKTIQQLTCFVIKNRVKSIFFTSDIVFLAFYACPHQKITENRKTFFHHFS